MRYRTLGLCIVLVLAGCSGATGGDSATTVTASDSPTATATPTETAAPTASPTDPPTTTPTASPSPTSTPTATATATPTPTSTPAPTPTATPREVLARDSLNRSAFAAAFREVLDRRNHTAGSLAYRNDTLVYEFRSRATNSSEYSREINRPATSYEAVVNDFEGYEPANLEIRATASDGDQIARYDVETAWAHEVENGTRTREEYLRAMAETERR